MADRNKICVKTVDLEGQAVSFAFANGNTVEARLTDFNKEILSQLALHGLSQKGGDAYSGEKDPQEAANLTLEVLDRLKAGEWGVKRQKGEGSITLTIEAIARLKQKDPSEIKTKYDAMSDEVKKSVRADPNVKAMVATIKAERAAAKAKSSETADTLAEF